MSIGPLSSRFLLELEREARYYRCMPKPRLAYLPALDGLRALAIIAVLLYHAEPAWLPGGFLGVDLFFVISAYLITALLCAEFNAPCVLNRRADDAHFASRGHAPARCSMDLRAFWARRARRLLPAAFVLIALALVVSVFWLPDEVAGLRGMGLSAAGYVTNWYLIFSGQSYFESAGRPSLLRHLWSLAVEEQFYLIWPLLLWGLLRIGSRRLSVAIIGAGIVASALWMAALYQPGEDPSRVYFGTDTRAATLLVGAALALVWSPSKQVSRSPQKSTRRSLGLSARERASPAAPGASQYSQSWVLSLGGALALAVLAALCLRINEADDRLYRGGLLGIALLGALAVAAAAHAPGLFARVLARNPLRWIGLRSYSLYLWHWPVFMLTRPQLDIALDGLPLLALRLALTLALAELSYRLIEMPARHGALGRAWQSVRAAHGRPARLALGAATLAALAAVVLLGRAAALASPPAPPQWLLDAQREQATLQSFANDPNPSSPAGARGQAIALKASGVADWLEPDSSGMAMAAGSDGSIPGLDRQAFLEAQGGLQPTTAGVKSLDPKLQDADAATHRGDARTQYLADSAISPGGTDVLLWDGPPVAHPPAGPGDNSLANMTDLPAATDARVTSVAPGSFQTVAQPAHGGDTLALGADRLDDINVPNAVDDSAPATPPASASEPAPTPDSKVARPAGLPPVRAQLTPDRAAEVTAIGDSVMLSAVGELRRVVGPIDIDAQIGRHTSTTIALLRARLDAEQLSPIVIIQTGDNGYLSVQEMRTMLALLGGVRRVVFINLHVPRAWEQNNNDILRGESQGRPNVVLVDWSTASAGHAEYFWNDGMHLRPEGARAYATLVAAALAAP